MSRLDQSIIQFFETAVSQAFSIKTESCCSRQRHGEWIDVRFIFLVSAADCEPQTPTGLINNDAEGGGGSLRTQRSLCELRIEPP